MTAETTPLLTPDETLDRLVDELGQRFCALEHVLPRVEDPRHAALMLDRVRDWTREAARVLEARRGEPAFWSTCEVCGAYSLGPWCRACEIWSDTGEWPVGI